MYTQLNQYHVVMEADPRFTQGPEGLQYVYVRGNKNTLVPLSAFTHYGPSVTPLQVNHTGQFPSITISFNLAAGHSLSDAVAEINNAAHDLALPASIHGSFSGTALAYQDSLASQPFL